MFNIGAGELIFIAVVALLILGPQRLPEFARIIGKYVREFRQQTDEIRTVVQREIYTMDQDFAAQQMSSPPEGPPVVPPGKGEGHLRQYAEALAAPAQVQGGPPPGTPDAAPGLEAPADGTREPADARPCLEPIPGMAAPTAAQNG